MTRLEEAAAPHVLRDYVLIADGWRGAMINPVGEMSWLCFPSWSDPAVFAGLLGSRGGYKVAPKGRHVRGGSYEDATLIWRQRWVTSSGILEVRDALALPSERERAVILRQLVAVEGPQVAVVDLSFAADYGRVPTVLWQRQGEAWTCRPDSIGARWTGAPDARLTGGDLRAEIRLEAGQHHDLVLEVAQTPMADLEVDADELWCNTETTWRRWVPECAGVTASRDVRQSVAVLRGLTTPDGATVAAATTALPERAEAGRNYDYRYAWLRDTCYIGRSAGLLAGTEDLFDASVRWVAQRLTWDGERTKPAYVFDGSNIPSTRHLGLPGYPGGSDIVGNEAGSQFQLDLFGEALLLFALAAEKDRLDADEWQAVEIAYRAIAGRHEEKESGVWEIEPEHWTHSRLICSAGLRAIAHAGPPTSWGTDALALADHLLATADRTSLHPSGRWQRAPGDPRVDASLLLAEIRGATTPDDPRAVATRTAIGTDLCRDGYLYRFADPDANLGKDEGAFLICSFWMALAKAGAGDHGGAVEWFERTRASCGSSGLFSEEYDVAQRQLRGNIPQAFVHALLVETALELSGD